MPIKGSSLFLLLCAITIGSAFFLASVQEPTAYGEPEPSHIYLWCLGLSPFIWAAFLLIARWLLGVDEIIEILKSATKPVIEPMYPEKKLGKHTKKPGDPDNFGE